MSSERQKFSTDLCPSLYRLKGTPIDRLQEGSKSSHSVFSSRANIAHDTHEVVRASLCTEAAGNLLLYLGESNAVLSLIVSERHRPIHGEPQDVGVIVSESFQKASGFPFCFATALAFRSAFCRISAIPSATRASYPPKYDARSSGG